MNEDKSIMELIEDIIELAEENKRIDSMRAEDFWNEWSRKLSGSSDG